MHDVSWRRIVDELVDDIVALTIHDGEEVYHYAEDESSQQELVPLLADAREDAFKPVHGTGEIEAHQTACHSQNDTSRYYVYGESFAQVEVKLWGCAIECV